MVAWRGRTDRGAAAAHALRHLALRQSEVLGQPLVGERLLQRVEVGTLQVLDQRQLE